MSGAQSLESVVDASPVIIRAGEVLQEALQEAAGRCVWS